MRKNKSAKHIRLTVVGAAGRMGTRIIALAQNDPRFQVMAGIEQPGSPFVGRFAGNGKVPIVGSLGEVLMKTDIVIDFSSPKSATKIATIAAKNKKALVIGTTGLTSPAVKKLKAQSRKIPIVYSPNMSVGMNVLFRLIEEAGTALREYDIEVVEAHHSLKKDSPSGTAMKLAEIAAAASKRSPKDFVYGRRGLLGARPKKEIGVLAIRAGDIVGDHMVLLSSAGERLELVHRAHSRDALASGALTAAAWAYKKRPGLYNMQDVLGLKR